jgi:mannose-6-phosphate isomerase-like protein (cupin superfamily)
VATETIRMTPTQTLEVRSSTPDALELTSTWEPTPKPPPTHWHPNQHEHFEVLSGELTVEVGGEGARVLRTGETLDLPPKTPHRMWNASTSTTTANWEITPALNTENLFRFMADGIGGLRNVLLLIKFRNEFRVGRPR